MGSYYKGHIKDLLNFQLRKDILNNNIDSFSWKISKRGQYYRKFDNGKYVIVYFDSGYVMIKSKSRKKYKKQKGDKSF